MKNFYSIKENPHNSEEHPEKDSFQIIQNEPEKPFLFVLSKDMAEDICYLLNKARHERLNLFTLVGRN